jgi:hypothetical protein
LIQVCHGALTGSEGKGLGPGVENDAGHEIMADSFGQMTRPAEVPGRHRRGGALARLSAAGVAVPYPVQIPGTELLLQFIGSADGTAAPGLARVGDPGVHYLVLDVSGA